MDNFKEKFSIMSVEDYDCNSSEQSEDEMYGDIEFSDEDDAVVTQDNSSSTSSDGFEEIKDMEVKVVERSALFTEINSMIDEVSCLMSLPRVTCHQLLKKFHWDKESLLEKYYENIDDTDRFLRSLQIELPASEESTSGNGECCICYCEENVTSLACKHWACDECWQQYIVHKITVDNIATIQCPDTDCEVCVDDEKILHHLIGTPEKTMESFNRLRLDNFIILQDHFTWCPAKECGRILKGASSAELPVTCPCGARFCFGCTEEWHEPVNCHQMKLWQKKCNDDSETSNWINAHTKDCPKCHSVIEKNGGCNVMDCRNPKCKVEFCWACLEITTNHGATHGCNKWNDSDDKTPKDAKNAARISLERYLHYYNRYANHKNSLRLEEKLIKIVEEKMRILQAKNSGTYNEVTFLRKAVAVLSECRQTLMFTYPFAFFLEKDNMCHVFEDNQNDLERATEQLSRVLERNMDDEQDFGEFSRNVQDTYRYVQQRRRILLQQCREGYQNDCWTFRE